MSKSTATQYTTDILERYELKYLIPREMVEPISQFVEPYCSMDEYSGKSHDGFYIVNNLYFDTPRLLFMRNRLDDTENRFNMRIRSYGAQPAPPYFFEIKQKKYDFVYKYRGRVTTEEWPAYLAAGDPPYPDSISKKEMKNLDLFRRLAFSYNATPQILTQYRRKAYVSNIDEYARVTFDIELRYQEEWDYNVKPNNDLMTAYDNQMHYEPGMDVILELKCYSARVPLWMINVVKSFNLEHRSFSKYGAGLSELRGFGEFDNSYRRSKLSFGR